MKHAIRLTWLVACAAILVAGCPGGGEGEGEGEEPGFQCSLGTLGPPTSQGPRGMMGDGLILMLALVALAIRKRSPVLARRGG